MQKMCKYIASHGQKKYGRIDGWTAKCAKSRESQGSLMKRVAVAGIAISFSAAVGWYILSPFAIVAGCRTAIVNFNAELTSECIDFPALRESLKSEIPALVSSQMRKNQEFAEGPLVNFGVAAFALMASSIIDAYVTPSGLRAAFDIVKARRVGESQTESQEGQAAANSSVQISNSLQTVSMQYVGFDKFLVKGAAINGLEIMLEFKRHGISRWKLTGVTLESALSP